MFLNILFLAAALCCFAYYLTLGFSVRFGQSLMWLWPLIGTVLLARFGIVAHMIRTGAPSPLPRFLITLIHAGSALLLALFIAVEGIIATGAFMKAPSNLDYIIVLGAKVNGTEPSGALRNRVRVAREYAEENPETLIIVSGGKGADEGISEAQCMYDILTAKGIDPARITMEDASTDTVSNIANSYAIIDAINAEKGKESATIGIVTNNFHVYRGVRIAEKAAGEDKTVYGIPVATTKFSLPHYLLREFCAVVVAVLRGEITI